MESILKKESSRHSMWRERMRRGRAVVCDDETELFECSKCGRFVEESGFIEVTTARDGALHLGVCEECARELLSLDNIFRFSSEIVKKFASPERNFDKFEYDIIAHFYTIDNLVEIARKDLRKRMALADETEKKDFIKESLNYIDMDIEEFLDCVDPSTAEACRDRKESLEKDTFF